MSKDKTETRFEALKRECDTLRQKTKSLQGIVDRLRHESEDVAQAALREIRADQSLGDGDTSMSELDGSSTHEDHPSDLLSAATTVQVSQSMLSLAETAAMTPDYHIAHRWDPYLPDEQTLLASSVGVDSVAYPTMALGADMSADGMTYEPADTHPLDTYRQDFQHVGELGGLSVEGMYAGAVAPQWYHVNHEQRSRRDWDK